MPNGYVPVRDITAQGGFVVEALLSPNIRAFTSNEVLGRYNELSVVNATGLTSPIYRLPAATVLGQICAVKNVNPVVDSAAPIEVRPQAGETLALGTFIFSGTVGESASFLSNGAGTWYLLSYSNGASGTGGGNLQASYDIGPDGLIATSGIGPVGVDVIRIQSDTIFAVDETVGPAHNLTVRAGFGNTSGGTLTLAGGDGDGAGSGNGGDVNIVAGFPETGEGQGGGSVTIQGANGDGAGAGGNVNLISGSGGVDGALNASKGASQGLIARIYQINIDASGTYVLNHSLNCQAPLVAIYNAAGTQVVPASVVQNSLNQITVTAVVAGGGVATVVGI